MIRMVTKEMFFERKVVIGAVDRATRKVLSRFGAFVRTGADRRAFSDRVPVRRA